MAKYITNYRDPPKTAWGAREGDLMNNNIHHLQVPGVILLCVLQISQALLALFSENREGEELLDEQGSGPLQVRLEIWRMNQNDHNWNITKQGVR